MVDNMIAGLQWLPDARLAALAANARRLAGEGREDAVRLLGAIDAERTRRGIVGLRPDGALWWEPANPAFPQFHGYADAGGSRRVATILKRTTHKADDKEVYSVEVMGHPVPCRFHRVAEARAAGSAAWQAMR